MDPVEIIRSALLTAPQDFSVRVCGFDCVIRRGRHIALRLSVGGPFYVNPTFTIVVAQQRSLFCEVKTEYVIARSDTYEPVYMIPNEILDITDTDKPADVLEHLVHTLLSNPYRRLASRTGNSAHEQRSSRA